MALQSYLYTTTFGMLNRYTGVSLQQAYENTGKRQHSGSLLTLLSVILGWRLSGNLCYRRRETPSVCSHRVTIRTKDNDYAGISSFAVADPVIWNSLPATLRTTTLSPALFAGHLKAHLLGWLAVRLRTIYDALYKSSHHHQLITALLI